MSNESEFPIVLINQVGIWEGTYLHLDPNDGSVLDKHKSKVEVAINGKRFTQRNHYIWDDGHERIDYYPALMKDGQLVYESRRLKGIAHVTNDSSVAFYAEYKDTKVIVYDVIRLLSDDHRIRTIQLSHNDKCTKLIHIDERRTSTQNITHEISKEDIFFDDW